jgi:hypothetical protein
MNAQIAYLNRLSLAEVEAIRNVNPVDALGEIRAQIAALKESEEIYLAQIKEAGVGSHDGSLFRASVSAVDDRESLDPKAMEAKLRELGVDGRWFTRNTKTTKGYVTVRVTARKSN